MKRIYVAKLAFACLSWLAVLYPPVAAGSDARMTAQSPKDPKATPTGKGRISGVLIEESGAPDANKEVLLVEAEVHDVTGKRVPQLPGSIGTVILDVISTKATVRTDNSGRFEFKGIPSGRYGVRVQLGGADKRLTFLRRQPNESTVVFDLAGGQEVDLGKVSAKPQAQF